MDDSASDHESLRVRGVSLYIYKLTQRRERMEMLSRWKSALIPFA